MAQKLRQDFYAFWILGLQPYIQVLLNDFEAAKRSLAKARELIAHKERTLPVYLSGFMMSQFLLDVSLLEQAFVSSHPSNISPLRRQTYRSGKAAVKNAAKYAADKTEAFKLMGVYYWLIGKQKKALKWWDKSIRTGEHLGARPELARTYMEVGKRLLEPKSKHGALNGLSAEDYLGKARALFEEMELAWDVQELEKILPDEGKNT